MARNVTEITSGAMTRARTRRPTAADVAHAAGVSRATVSYVLNDTPHQVIPEATRQRVRDAARDLGYTPSAAARSLTTGRSEVVLLLLPDWPIGPSVGGLLEGLSAALGRHGLTFVVHPRSAKRPVAEVWKTLTPAAVVTFEALSEADQQRLQSAGIEVILPLFGERNRSTRAMAVPEERTGRLQVEHLAAAGHRHLAYAWPHDPRVETFARSRLEGARQACAELGLDEPLVTTVPMQPVGVGAAIRSWSAATPRITGVCAYNDDLALALLAGARGQQLQVPGDIAIVGVDDVPMAALSLPALTTVRVDVVLLADFIADTLVRKLHGLSAPRRPGSDIHQVVQRDSA